MICLPISRGVLDKLVDERKTYLFIRKNNILYCYNHGAIKLKDGIKRYDLCSQYEDIKNITDAAKLELQNEPDGVYAIHSETGEWYTTTLTAIEKNIIHEHELEFSSKDS